MNSTRAHRAVLAVAYAVVATAWAADRVVVEDWRSYPHGTRGIPRDWKSRPGESPPTTSRSFRTTVSRSCTEEQG